MRDLDLRLLRYFVTLAEHQSFTAAAETLGVSQPALSQGIRRLEDVVGAQLIGRPPRGSSRAFTLTGAGKGLLEDARHLLAHAGRVMKHARDNAGRMTVRIGFGTSTPHTLPRAVLDSAGDIPHIEIRLEFVRWGDEIGALERGDIDATFLLAPAAFSDPRLDVVPLGVLGRLGVFAADHRLAWRQEIRLADIEDEPIIDAASDRSYWLVSPRPSGRRPVTVAPAARTVDEMLTFVAAGRGMAITSETVAEKHSWPGLAFVPIADLEPSTIFLAGHRSEPRAEVRHVLQHLGGAMAAAQPRR